MEILTKEEIFINLTVLSKIEPGDKLFLKDNTLLNIDTSLFPSLTRWLNGSNRMTILYFINQLLNLSFDFHKNGQKKKNNNLFFD